MTGDASYKLHDRAFAGDLESVIDALRTCDVNDKGKFDITALHAAGVPECACLRTSD
jgi:hypothetical protein